MEKNEKQERSENNIILENWGQPGPEATCTQAAALRYAIRVHLKHLDQFEKRKKNQLVDKRTRAFQRKG